MVNDTVSVSSPDSTTNTLRPIPARYSTRERKLLGLSNAPSTGAKRRGEESIFLMDWDSRTSPSSVTGDHSPKLVPSLRAVQPDSQSVVVLEALSASSLDRTTLRPVRAAGGECAGAAGRGAAAGRGGAPRGAGGPISPIDLPRKENRDLDLRPSRVKPMKGPPSDEAPVCSSRVPPL
eukprot:1193292-Prorocentrum_minimum.AAC.1